MSSISLTYFLKKCLLLFALVHCTVFSFAQAQTTQATAKAPAITVLRALILVSPAPKTRDAVLATPALGWQNFNADTTYPLSDHNVLWIKLQISVSSTPTGWVLKLPKPFLDRVELHLPNMDGTWRMLAAGDQVVHRDWPLRGLHPQFALPTFSEGEHTVFLKVYNRVPANFEVQTLSAQDANADSLEHYVRSGLVLIFFVCLTFISASLAMVYKDAAYGWYSLYTALAALTVAAYTGLANYLLWPEATHWPEVSIHVTLLLSIMAQMVFCYVTFEPQKLWAKFTLVGWLTAGLTLVCIAVLVIFTNIFLLSASFFFALLVNGAVIMAFVYGRLRRGELSAKLWILAYTPLACLIFLSSMDHHGMTPQPLVGYYWPAYALAFEIPILLLALMQRAKARDAQTVMQRVHQQLDPLTGFILPRAYTARVLPLWERSTSLGLDLTVVYVQITQPDLPSAMLGGRSYMPRSERIVRVLRTVFRQDDVYAQLADDNVYAILMPGQALGDELQNRLIRLVAQMHMLSQELKTDYPLRTRAVACSNKSLPVSWQQVHQTLLDKFSNDKAWGKRSIRYATTRSGRSDHAETDLSAFWARALEVTSGKNNSTTLQTIQTEHPDVLH